MPTVLIVDDDPALRRVLATIVRRAGAEVVEAEDGVVAIGKLRSAQLDLVVTDLRMPRADGFAVLEALREQRGAPPVIMLTGEGSIADCVRAMKAGAANFLSKPFDGDELERVVRELLAEPKAADKPSKRAEPAKGRPQVALIGESARLRAVLETVAQVADTDATVLLTGETGTGKEVIARLLHGASRRAAKPFVTVNCGAIPDGLVESELFGHAKGAFTGATDRHVGRFVRADGGTLFLDEIGELPLHVQVKLLRVIQDREVTPVGEVRAQTVDLRLVAATHRNLEAMTAEGTFREDLYYRLNVVPIEIPALRERAEDIPALARYFLDAAARRFGKTLAFAPEALELLASWRWPGNVRELENLIERMAILDRTGTIDVDALPGKLRDEPSTPAGSPAAPPAATGDMASAVAKVEDALIDDALRKAGGNKAQAARMLGINRTTLVERLKRRQRDP